MSSSHFSFSSAKENWTEPVCVSSSTDYAEYLWVLCVLFVRLLFHPEAKSQWEQRITSTSVWRFLLRFQHPCHLLTSQKRSSAVEEVGSNKSSCNFPTRRYTSSSFIQSILTVCLWFLFVSSVFGFYYLSGRLSLLSSFICSCLLLVLSAAGLPPIFFFCSYISLSCSLFCTLWSFLWSFLHSIFFLNSLYLNSSCYCRSSHWDQLLLLY